MDFCTDCHLEHRIYALLRYLYLIFLKQIAETSGIAVVNLYLIHNFDNPDMDQAVADVAFTKAEKLLLVCIFIHVIEPFENHLYMITVQVDYN